MRPTGTRQSARRAPLNSILGTEVNVRLLRLLTEFAGPATAAQLAREAGLSSPGVYQALEGLSGQGVVERVGRGSRGAFQLRAKHPLARALKLLFEAERGQFQRLLNDLHAAASELSPPPRSVWMFGTVADRSDRPGEPVRLAVVAGSKDIDRLIDTFHEALTRLEERHDVRIDLRALTGADIQSAGEDERHMLERAMVISGLPPGAVLGTPASKRGKRPVHRGQAQHDERLLQIAASVAKMLERDPGVVDRARRHIRMRTRVASPGERKELEEWDRILRTMSVKQLQRFLVDRGDRAARLRQSLPFLEGVDHPHQTFAEEMGR